MKQLEIAGTPPRRCNAMKTCEARQAIEQTRYEYADVVFLQVFSGQRSLKRQQREQRDRNEAQAKVVDGARIGPGESDQVEQREGQRANDAHVLETRQAMRVVGPVVFEQPAENVHLCFAVMQPKVLPGLCSVSVLAPAGHCPQGNRHAAMQQRSGRERVRDLAVRHEVQQRQELVGREHKPPCGGQSGRWDECCSADVSGARVSSRSDDSSLRGKDKSERLSIMFTLP